MRPWKRYWLHLVVGVLAVLGAASGLVGSTSAPGTAFWMFCLASALYNAVLFGVGWQQRRSATARTTSNG